MPEMLSLVYLIPLCCGSLDSLLCILQQVSFVLLDDFLQNFVKVTKDTSLQGAIQVMSRNQGLVCVKKLGNVAVKGVTISC
jgi:hypothetical protein